MGPQGCITARAALGLWGCPGDTHGAQTLPPPTPGYRHVFFASLPVRTRQPRGLGRASCSQPTPGSDLSRCAHFLPLLAIFRNLLGPSLRGAGPALGLARVGVATPPGHPSYCHSFVTAKPQPHRAPTVGSAATAVRWGDSAPGLRPRPARSRTSLPAQTPRPPSTPRPHPLNLRGPGLGGAPPPACRESLSGPVHCVADVSKTRPDKTQVFVFMFDSPQDGARGCCPGLGGREEGARATHRLRRLPRPRVGRGQTPFGTTGMCFAAHRRCAWPRRRSCMQWTPPCPATVAGGQRAVGSPAANTCVTPGGRATQGDSAVFRARAA